MCYLYPQFYLPYNFINYFPVRQFPPVDPNVFSESANEMKTLMNDASNVLDKLAASKQFAKELMTAAQESDVKEVERLIHTVDIASEIDVNFNPDSLRLEYRRKVTNNEMECCRLLVTLRWR
ncbi:hypothetical protein ACDX78_22980 [Virgibacillus oceani]